MQMVTFYKIDDKGEPSVPVLYLDTLKVSTIEQTAENVSARGGKGNPELVSWDYGKEITLTLEDALFSAKSMAMMYGVDVADGNDFGSENTVLKTINDLSAISGDSLIINGQAFAVVGGSTGITYYDENGATTASASAKYATAKITVAGQKIVISSDKFPGTYYVTGDTYARSETTGEDELTWNSSLAA